MVPIRDVIRTNAGARYLASTVATAERNVGSLRRPITERFTTLLRRTSLKQPYCRPTQHRGTDRDPHCRHNGRS
jgi:hypothetical protein